MNAEAGDQARLKHCSDVLASGMTQISATNLSANYSLLSGAVTSLGMSLLCCIVISLVFPAKEKFQWSAFTENITMVDDKVSFWPHLPRR